MATLYNISERYQNLLELCFSDNVDSDLLATAISTVDEELTDKVHNGIAIIRELQNRVNSIDAEIKRLAAFKNIIDANLEHIKQYYLDNLNSIGKSKVTTDIGSMTVAKAGGLKPLIIDDEDAIPADFKRVIYKTEIDKDAIRQALNSSENVDGAHLAERKFYLKVS